MPNTLNIIGCGKVGKTIGRLWAERGTFAILDVLNRSMDSACDAVGFIQSGRPLECYADLRAADVYLIGTPDDQIATACQQLLHLGLLQAGNVVFHCSGALPSSVLRTALPPGVLVASIHPIRSFADPAQAATAFAGTVCGVEGDEAALALLNPAFTEIGARTVAIDADFKTIYHAAAVFASNYLVTLLDVALEAYRKAGISPDTALALMQPLVQGTVDNVFRLGPTAALTGPIARGDTATVERQFHAIAEWDERYADLYGQFAQLATEIAARKSDRNH